MTKYIRNKNAISGRLHDEMVMMDMEQGKYFSLNQVATTIWDNLEKPLSAEELCQLLQEEFEVEKEKCLKEVEEHLAEMIKLKLISVAG